MYTKKSLEQADYRKVSENVSCRVCFSLCHAIGSLYFDRKLILFEGQRQLSLQHIYSVHISMSGIFFFAFNGNSFPLSL